MWDLVASNPRTPNKALAHLARRFQGSYTHSRVAWRVAQNRRAGPDLLSQLADSPSGEVRLLAAAHPAVPGFVLESRWPATMTASCAMRVAWNSSTPVPMLRQLAADETLRVRMGVASNASTPLDVSGDAVGGPLRGGTAPMPWPIPTRRSIWSRRGQRIGRSPCAAPWRIVHNPSRFFWLWRRIRNGSVRAHVADNETAPEAVLESLANGRVRLGASRSGRSPQHIPSALLHHWRPMRTSGSGTVSLRTRRPMTIFSLCWPSMRIRW